MLPLIKIKWIAGILVGSLIFFTGCKKYLDQKSNQSLSALSSVQDLQSLLDNFYPVNTYDPIAGEVSADNYYVYDADWSGLDDYARNTYSWQKDNLFRPGNFNDWSLAYNNVYRANTVLGNINKINRTPGDQDDWNNAKGSALFLRGKTFLQVAWVWALAYDETTSSTDMGIPLRLDPDFNEPSVRATMQQTYDQVISDLEASIPLLPVTPIHLVRPSKSAAYGWLARAYLSMRKYDSAWLYADRCLQSNNHLLDYNTLNPSAFPPIESFNPEVIFQNELDAPIILYNPIAKIDSILYASYDNNDLRKTVCFSDNHDGTFSFQGSYAGSDYIDYPFDGIATDEMYLTRAECYARKGDVGDAMNDLNTLMVKRWVSGLFVPFTATDATDALNKILLERRKELLFRGSRWVDIKRLNKEGANIVLKRIMNGQLYTLPPNDPRYALAIPADVIAISKMPQNPR
ncbi:MAG: RagB/SusD family nutrient uptake outer membrane protein [Bacteroidota bacterium]|nr:RagB/SusD family nutrient uptake outer membrane protein [Bacteroidota bacterium]MDP4213066.1 RagB/SusD family nutrient uptake outer membrane protein [Bacteroidota bacterium]MDP4252182.1 RagB/SusD family nutrient uptake outer membrane protein [Bacteroidota bacterium]